VICYTFLGKIFWYCDYGGETDVSLNCVHSHSQHSHWVALLVQLIDNISFTLTCACLKTLGSTASEGRVEDWGPVPADTLDMWPG
jgi:hypothetical protein